MNPQAVQTRRSGSAAFSRLASRVPPQAGQKRYSGCCISHDYNASMAILKVARMGHPVLRARAKTVDPTVIRSPAFQRLIDDMFETMREYQGVGLAAPQIHESLRLFVAGFASSPDDDEDPDRRVPLMALINPEITPASADVVEDWE